MSEFDKFVQNIGTQDKSVKTNSVEIYRGEKDQKDRIALPSGNVFRAWTWFVDNVGHVFCEDPTDTSHPLYKHFGPPKMRCGAAIVQYLTKKDGSVRSPLQLDVKVWRFSENRYVYLRDLDAKWAPHGGLKSHDLEVSCTEPKFQKMDIMICPEVLWKASTWAGKSKEVEEAAQKRERALLADIAAIEAQIPRGLGRIMSTEDVLEKIGEATSGTAAPPSSADSVQDVEDLLSQLGKPVSSED